MAICHLSVHGRSCPSTSFSANDPGECGRGSHRLVSRIKRFEPIGRLETPIVREARIFCLDG